MEKAEIDLLEEIRAYREQQLLTKSPQRKWQLQRHIDKCKKELKKVRLKYYKEKNNG